MQSKVCSTSSLNSDPNPTSVSHSLSSAIEIARDDAGETSSLLGKDNIESLPLSPPVFSMMQSGSSNPISIKNKRLNSRDLMLSSSAPTSASSSPLPGHRNSPRQQFYRVRKSSSSSSLTVFIGALFFCSFFRFFLVFFFLFLFDFFLFFQFFSFFLFALFSVFFCFSFRFFFLSIFFLFFFSSLVFLFRFFSLFFTLLLYTTYECSTTATILL